MIRPSSLALAEKCTESAYLAQEHNEGSDATERGSLVDDQITAAIRTGVAPTDPDALACYEWVLATFPGYELYPQERVQFIDPETGEVVTEGTTDLLAVKPGVEVVVVDYKKREQYDAGRLTPPDENLQPHTYAVAAGQRFNVASYRMFLLLFGDGQVEPLASREYHETEWWDIIDRACRINRAPRRIVKGDHCGGCWQRKHCRAWILPTADAPSALEAFGKPGGLTPENAAAAVLFVTAVRDMLEIAKGQLESFVDEHGPIRAGGREWGPTSVAGRRSGPSVEECIRAGRPDLVKPGRPSTRYQWKKIR